MKQRLKRIIAWLLVLVPRRLPIGRAQFERLAARILDMTGLPQNPSFVQAIANSVLQLKPQQAYRADAYFVLTILKACANQVAYNIAMEIRSQEKDEDAKRATETVV